MSSRSSNSAAKRFIAVEYEGRHVAVRRSANYDTMITLVQEVFRSLSPVLATRISISAYVDEIGDTLEVSRSIWPDLLPEFKRITILLDSPSTESIESVFDSDDDQLDDEILSENDQTGQAAGVPLESSPELVEPFAQLDQDDPTDETSSVIGPTDSAPSSFFGTSLLRPVPAPPQIHQQSYVTHRTIPEQPKKWNQVDHRNVKHRTATLEELAW